MCSCCNLTIRDFLPSRGGSILIVVVLMLMSMSNAYAGLVPLEEAAARVVELDGEERMAAQRQFLSAYREQSDAFVDHYRSASQTDIKSLYVWALGEIGTEEVCRELSAITAELSLEDPPGLRMSAANAQARCGFYELLVELLLGNAPILQAKAAIQLGLHEVSAVRGELQRLATEDSVSRYHVFFKMALGLLGDESQKDLLKELLHQRDARVYAALALARMGEDSVVVDLQMALDDEESVIRIYAIEAMVELRVEGSDTSIRELLDDPNPRVKAKAEWALRRINRRKRDE